MTESAEPGVGPAVVEMVGHVDAVNARVSIGRLAEAGEVVVLDIRQTEIDKSWTALTADEARALAAALLEAANRIAR